MEHRISFSWAVRGPVMACASVKAVWHWRGVLSVDRLNNPGTHRRVVAAVILGADELRGNPLPLEAVKERRRRAIAQNLGRNLKLAPVCLSPVTTTTRNRTMLDFINPSAEE